MRARALISFGLLLAGSCFGFPEMVRNGYGNCITCHFSPSGAGLINDYGRALSGEVLSTWSAENEGAFLWGILPSTKPMAFGGDIRLLELFQSMNQRTSLMFIPMQRDGEAALDLTKVQLVGTAGVDNNGNFISRRHYAVYRPTDTLSLRAGRFFSAFGINTENHSLGILRGLGRDQGMETYNIEAAWLDTSFDAFLTGVFGRPDDPQLDAETGIAASSSVFLDNRFKVGASYYYGSRATEQRHVAGPFAILGFTPHLFLLAQLDFQWMFPQSAGAASSVGLVDDMRFDIELVQGFHLYLLQEYLMLDLQDGSSMSDMYGIGAQWFPRPHFEFNLIYQRQRIGGTGAPFAEIAYGLFHYYL